MIVIIRRLRLLHCDCYQLQIRMTNTAIKLSLLVAVLVCVSTSSTTEATSESVVGKDLMHECWAHCRRYFEECKVFYKCLIHTLEDEHLPCAKYCLERSNECYTRCVAK